MVYDPGIDNPMFTKPVTGLIVNPAGELENVPPAKPVTVGSGSG